MLKLFKSTNFSFASDIFSSMSLSSMLQAAGFYKTKGLTAVTLLLEAICAIIVAATPNAYIRHGKTYEAEKLSKSPFYRFLSLANVNWRKFHEQVSLSAVKKTSKLTKKRSRKCLIIDDSNINRGRSRAIELMAKIFNHVDKRFELGFTYLALAWTDGFSTFPLDFALMSSKKDEYCFNKPEHMDTRKSSDKRKKESRLSKPEVVLQMIKKALDQGIEADTVLFDTWFTTAPLVTKIRSLGVHVIGMLKHMSNNCYLYKNTRYSLRELIDVLSQRGAFKYDGSGVYCSIVVTMCGSRKKPANLKVKLVFVRDRNNPSKVLTLLCTDLTMSDSDIIQTYGKRWKIEEMFYTQKNYLKLVTGSRARNYNSLIAHFTLVNIANIFLEFHRRWHEDKKSIGGIFEECCEDIRDIPFDIALTKLLSIIYNIIDDLKLKGCLKEGMYDMAIKIADDHIQQWFMALPRFLTERYGLMAS